MKTEFFWGIALLALGTNLSAQAQAPSPYAGEAIYYSRLQFGGPARTQGIAGANVALGGDFGNLTSNPAGLGFFRKSEFNVSPGLGLGSADASVNGSATSQNQTKNSFHIASIGAVFTNRRADDDQASNWRGGSFALGFSRLADFNTAFRYSGQVADSKSLFQRLREPGGYAVGTGGYNVALDSIDSHYRYNSPSTLEDLAYNTYLTNFSTTGDTLNIRKPLLRDTLKTVSQTETVTRSGSVSQFDLGYGGSYKDKLFIGGAIGIVSSNSTTTRDFSETRNSLDAGTSFGSLLLHDVVKTTGTGINARIGLIYRLNDAVRFGASVQTPTYIQLTDTYSMSLTTQFDKTVNITYQSGASIPVNGNYYSLPTGQYVYSITTPFRANGGVALTLGKHGFVTGDIEYLGYQQARLSSNPSNAYGDNYSFSQENQTISTFYQSAINLRFGAEARFDIFRIRAGYANYGDPYRNSTVDRSQQFYTLGAGFRQNNFFLDVAGVYTTYNQLYSPYTLVSNQQPVINVKANRYTTTVTAGFTF